MKLKKPINVNYCATIMTISNTLKLDNCDNVVAGIVSGYQVIVSKDSKKGDIGVFFPVETQLSTQFLYNNNLYREATLNKDETKKGYIEKNSRLKCLKFRGHKSEGLFIPLKSLEWTGINIADLKEGDEFDYLLSLEICRKYYPKHNNKNKINTKNGKTKKRIKKISKMVEGQFRLHCDTSQLKKNIHRITPDTIISISAKMHGTSAVFSKVLVKRKLNTIEKILKFVGVKIQDSENTITYSSRKVIKNEFFTNKKAQGYYSKNIWEEHAFRIENLIPSGMTVYGEIVGYIGKDSFVQKGFHYGCSNGTSELYIYRITLTNNNGEVFELNRTQIDDYCTRVGLKSTQLFYYGKARDLYPDIICDDNWHSNVLTKLDNDPNYHMNNIKCPLNNGEVPAEGCVVRIENMYDAAPFKLKNYDFLTYESKLMDKGEVDIESEQSEVTDEC